MPVRISRKAKQLRGTFRADREAANPPKPEASPVPPAPESLSETEQKVWGELAPQVELLGTYTPACFTAFRVLVRVVALLDGAPPDMAASALVRLAQVASSLLARFGLDPMSAERVEAAPRPDEDEDDFSEFLSPGEPRPSRPAQ
jgi:phage terminase small subunit